MRRWHPCLHRSASIPSPGSHGPNGPCPQSSSPLFDPIFIMTDGGPADATRTLSYYIYARGFQSLRMGYAAALSWVLFAIILLFTLFQWLLQKRWVFYQ